MLAFFSPFLVGRLVAKESFSLRPSGVVCVCVGGCVCARISVTVLLCIVVYIVYCSSRVACQVPVDVVGGCTCIPGSR